MFGKIKSSIHMSIDELFATAVVDELAGDTKEYQAKLEVITQIAELLGINTEITTVTLNLRKDAPLTNGLDEHAINDLLEKTE